MERYRGAAFTALAAVIFGFTPILARMAYDGGANGVTVTFLRAALSLPILYGILRIRGVSVRVSGIELRNVCLLGVVGSSATTLCLYGAYSYISVGMATTIHFIYPTITTLCCILFFKERLNAFKLAAMLLTTIGVGCFLERGAGAGAAVGVALAVVSGFTYAFYIVGVDKTGTKNMYYFKLSFYLCVFTALSAGTFGLATGSLALGAMTPAAWGYSFLVSVFVSVGALALFQLGVRYVGASTAGVLSTLEPITSVILGVLILREELSWAKLVGCIIIILGILMITLSEMRYPPPAPADTENIADCRKE